MRNILLFCTFAITATSASASPILPRLSWTVSADGGVTWSRNAEFVSPRTVLVRGNLSWSDSGSGPVGLGAAVCSFDGSLTGLLAADSVSNIVKTLVPVADSQVLAFSRFGTAGKIDIDTDVAVAGAGPGWVNTGQGTMLALGNQFVPSDNVTVLTYTFHIGGDAHQVQIGSILNSAINQAVRIYVTEAGGTSGGGQFSRSQVLVEQATVAIIFPTPASASLMVLGSVALIRRRRA